MADKNTPGEKAGADANRGAAGEPSGESVGEFHGDARALAARVLERVELDDAYAAAALDAEFGRADLSRRDRALATELVYGTLRLRSVLVQELEKHADRGLPKARKDADVRAALCIAAYQILVLDRIPAFAAVGAAVETIRRKRGPGMAGFANALLRRLADSGAKLDPVAASFDALPQWLRGRLTKSLGEEQARGLVAPVSEATTAIRLVAGHEVPEWLRDAPAGYVSPLAKRVRGVGDLRRQPGWDEGAFVVQEEGSQLIALAVGARPGEWILDACAGRGQKTSLLAERVLATEAGKPDGSVTAVDLHEHRLAALRTEMDRLGLGPHVQTIAADWTAADESDDASKSVASAEGVPLRASARARARARVPVPGDFDRVLVDAPCTGVGTLRHRPEIALRMVPEDAPRMGELAAQILRQAALKARPGGRGVYAVCSVFKAECENVLKSVSDVLESTPFDAPELQQIVAKEPKNESAARCTSLRLLPSKHGTDGYFLASLRRK